jgi:hypothetical protein
MSEKTKRYNFKGIQHLVKIIFLLLLIIFVLSSCYQGPVDDEHSEGEFDTQDKLPLVNHAFSQTLTPRSYGNQLTDYDIEVFDVLLGGAAGNNPTAYDALRVCPNIITELRFGDESTWTEDLLTPLCELMEFLKQNQKLPRAPYNEIITEYTTSMDAPLLGVALQLAYERTGDLIYREYLEELIPYIALSTDEGGFILTLSDEMWWPLEYAWRGVTEETAWFALNGSLFGMVAITMLERVTNDIRLAMICEKAEAAYCHLIDNFDYVDKKWCWYSLSYLDDRPIINTIEKLIIELRASKALYLMTGKDIYFDYWQRRSLLLEKLLPLYVYEEGGVHTATLLRSAPPHPYLIEIYPSLLEIYDSNNQVIANSEADSRAVSFATMISTFNHKASYYKLWGKVNPTDYTLFVQAPVKYIMPDELWVEPVSGKWSIDGDSVFLTDGLWGIDSQSSDKLNAGAVFSLAHTESVDANTYFVIEVENPTINVYETRLYLYSEGGDAIWRTSTPIRPGKSLMVFSSIGFKDYQEFPSVSKLGIRLVTNKMEIDPANVSIGNIYVFKTPIAFATYMDRYEFEDFWTVRKF